MALAGWLVDRGFEQDFVVVPDAALWPGAHQASNLLTVYQEAAAQGRQATTAELRNAMQGDLELVPFEVFVLTRLLLRPVWSCRRSAGLKMSV